MKIRVLVDENYNFFIFYFFYFDHLHFRITDIILFVWVDCFDCMVTKNTGENIYYIKIVF